MGHSFGGWTALMLGGASVDIKAANAACKAGAKSNITCKYTALLGDEGLPIQPTKPTPGLAAIVALAPGGHSSFGGTLAKVTVPTLVFGGTRDTTTSLDAEIDPIYADLPAPKARAVLKDAAHMSFTDVCALPFGRTLLADMCVVPDQTDAARASRITRTIAVAWLDRHVKGLDVAAPMLKGDALTTAFPELMWNAAP